jgi:hypothetical protein
MCGFGVVMSMLVHEYSLLGAVTGFISKSDVSNYDEFISKILATLPSCYKLPDQNMGFYYNPKLDLWYHPQDDNLDKRTFLAYSEKFLLSIKYWEWGSLKYYALNLEVIPNRISHLSRSVLYKNAQNIFRKLAHDYPVQTHTEDFYESYVLDLRNTRLASH